MPSSEYTATIEWRGDGTAFVDKRYSRRHRWLFDGGASVSASASPHLVPEPMSDPAAVDPEEAFVASIASCHMLWFLSLAARQGFVVASYRDRSTGVMARDPDGKLAITLVTLHPHAVFAGTRSPSASELQALHHAAHESCFIASSVKSEIRCEPVLAAGQPGASE